MPPGQNPWMLTPRGMPQPNEESGPYAPPAGKSMPSPELRYGQVRTSLYKSTPKPAVIRPLQQSIPIPAHGLSPSLIPLRAPTNHFPVRLSQSNSRGRLCSRFRKFRCYRLINAFYRYCRVKSMTKLAPHPDRCPEALSCFGSSHPCCNRNKDGLDRG
jgi:hypothetical protein